MPGEHRLRDLAGAPLPGDATRSFWRAATQRRDTAVFLLRSMEPGRYLDSVYLAGYAVECALKALILKRTLPPQRRVILDELTSGAQGHNLDFLVRILRAKGCSPPKEIREALVVLNREWRTDLRYKGALISFRETEDFLKRVNAVYEWAERS